MKANQANNSTFVVGHVCSLKPQPVIGAFRYCQVKLPIWQYCSAVSFNRCRIDRESAEAGYLGPDVPLYKVMLYQACCVAPDQGVLTRAYSLHCCLCCSIRRYFRVTACSTIASPRWFWFVDRSLVTNYRRFLTALRGFRWSTWSQVFWECNF